MARTNRPDEAYHIPTLNFWFAISSIVLLVTCVWMIWADYNRSWKVHQREFREFEISRLSNEKALAEAKLEEDDVKAKLDGAKAKLAVAEQALTGQRDEVTAVDQEIGELDKALYIAKQNFNFKGADLGKAKYDAEHDFKHYAGDAARLKEVQAAYDVVAAESDALKTAMLDAQDAMEDAEAKRAALLKNKSDAEGTIAALRGEVIKAEKTLAKVGHSFFNDVFRDAPVVDFIRPTIKIEQIVIPDLRDDYNFATVQKEDRCQTCHLGIDKKTHVLRADTGRFDQAATRGAFEADLWTSIRATITSTAPAADHEDLLADFDENFAQNPELTLKVWATENLEDWDGLADAVLANSADAQALLKERVTVYAAHSNLDLYLTSMSPHPKEEVGCSSCHEGRGHAVEFQRVYHTPQNAEQQAEWEEKYHWHEAHYWDHVQLPLGRVTSSCAKCHDADVTITGADAYNEGKRLVQAAGCPGCHQMGGITDKLRKVGPDLRKYAAKVTDKNFAYQWIWNPQAFRPSTKMPRFFGQSNNNEAANPAFFAKTKQEVLGIVAYLYGKTDAFELDPIPVAGDAARGDTLFEEVGCLGCHSKESSGNTVNNHGPDLSGLGSKLSQEFIYNWILNPKRYFAKTHMPSLRLTNQEAADIAAYLGGETKEGWTTEAMPARDEEAQMGLLRDAMAGTMRRSQIEDTLKAMSADEREFDLGRRTLIKYGCTGCHTIHGMEKASPIGAELTTWASKFKTQLDFGNFGHDEMPHNHIAWLTKKLGNPRIYDQSKETTKTFDALLKMPKFNFTPEEIDKVVTFILSRSKRHINEPKWPVQTAERQAIQKGEWVVEQFNCKGCHYFQGEGGNFAQYWKVNSAGVAQFHSSAGNPNFDYLEDVEGPVRGHVPPVLLDQGNKTEPAWLFDFFAEPTMLRPKLKMRMPSFGFTDDQANALIGLFAGIEGHGVGEISSYEPDPELAVLGQQLFENGKCTRCHMFTDNDVPRSEIPRGVVAPNLKLAADRLQHTWTPRWLEDPQSIMPGAMMPNYFDMTSKFTALDTDGTMLGKDMHKGMNALRDYLEVAGKSYKGAAKTAKK